MKNPLNKSYNDFRKNGLPKSQSQYSGMPMQTKPLVTSPPKSQLATGSRVDKPTYIIDSESPAERSLREYMLSKGVTAIPYAQSERGKAAINESKSNSEAAAANARLDIERQRYEAENKRQVDAEKRSKRRAQLRAEINRLNSDPGNKYQGVQTVIGVANAIRVRWLQEELEKLDY